jgi:hypothetical protein
MENGEIDSVGGTGSAAGAADEHRPRRAVPRWLPATWQPDPRPQTDIGQPRWRILHSWVYPPLRPSTAGAAVLALRDSD